MGKNSKESYYKILGTTAKIGQGRIKEKYIAAVKQHPPETDPEGFEKVREAYETLKDPTKRKEYDLYRKYGDNVENLIEEALTAIDKGNHDKAKNLLQKASKIAPNNLEVNASFMYLAISNNDLPEVEKAFERTLTTVFSDEEAAVMYTVKARVLYEADYHDEAIETLRQGAERYPEHATFFAMPLASMYLETEQFTEALKVMESAAPLQRDGEFEGAQHYLAWIGMIIMTEEWSVLSKAQAKFKKFLKGVTLEEEIDGLRDELMEAYEEYEERGQFREAEIYIDLAKFLMGHKDPELKELLNETKKKARLQKEIDKLARDQEMFPLIFLNAFEWFYSDILPPWEVNEALNELPGFMIEEMKEDKEEYAAAIIRTRKKYALIYKEFKGQWDTLFAELTEGFNRQMKRDLGKHR